MRSRGNRVEEWPRGHPESDNGRMPLTQQRSSTADLVRAGVVAVLAADRRRVAGRQRRLRRVGRGGRAGVSLARAARRTFAIWGPIYLAFFGYAIYQRFPGSGAVTCTAPRAGGWPRRPCSTRPGSWRSRRGTCCSRSCSLSRCWWCWPGCTAGCRGSVLEHDRRARGTAPAGGALHRVGLDRGGRRHRRDVRLGLPAQGALAVIAGVLVLLVAAGIVAAVVTNATAVSAMPRPWCGPSWGSR